VGGDYYKFMKVKKLKFSLAILVIIYLLLPSFAYLQNNNFSPPDTLDELKVKGGNAMGNFFKNIPQSFKTFFKEDVLPVWLKMYNWCKKTFWDPHLGPFFQREVEKRKPIINEEFQKEKNQMKESAKNEVPQATKSLWQRLKELFK